MMQQAWEGNKWRCGGSQKGWNLVGGGAPEGQLGIDVEPVRNHLGGHAVPAGDEDGIDEGVGACDKASRECHQPNSHPLGKISKLGTGEKLSCRYLCISLHPSLPNTPPFHPAPSRFLLQP